jgi:TolA-binding protein
MLNVSATQELAKKVETLEQQIRDQNTKIATLETENAKLAAMAAQMEALKKAVAAIQSKDSSVGRSVVLNR